MSLISNESFKYYLCHRISELTQRLNRLSEKERCMAPPISPEVKRVLEKAKELEKERLPTEKDILKEDKEFTKEAKQLPRLLKRLPGHTRRIKKKK